jgi:hypothetical protein
VPVISAGARAEPLQRRQDVCALRAQIDRDVAQKKAAATRVKY